MFRGIFKAPKSNKQGMKACGSSSTMLADPASACNEKDLESLANSFSSSTLSISCSTHAAPVFSISLPTPTIVPFALAPPIAPGSPQSTSPRNLAVKLAHPHTESWGSSSRMGSGSPAPPSTMSTRRTRFSLEASETVAHIGRPLSASDFEIICTVGCGSFGRVYLAQDLRSREPVAIKVIRKADVLRTSDLAQLLSEHRAMQLVQCSPFLVGFHGSYQDAEHVYFVLEYCPGGELFSVCVNRGQLPESDARKYTAEVLLGLEALHDAKYAYRDLKPENIILDAQGHVRLCDYGFIKRIREDDGCFTLCGTPEYSAPEMILNTGHSFPVDFWSLGILIYEMVTGFTPFSCPDQSNATLFRKIVQGEFQAPAGVSAACCDLIRRLLVQDPLQRLGSGLGGVEEIMAHPWFDGVDWEAVAAKKLSMPFQPELSGRFDTSAFQMPEEESCGLRKGSYPLTEHQQLLFRDF